MTSIGTAVFVASLTGSLHCAGMCGGLVAVYAGGPSSSPARRWAGHLAYNLGRLAAYAALGAAAGAAGRALDLAGSLAGIGRAAEIVAGTLIALWGAHALALARGLRVPSLAAPGWLRGRFGRGLALLENRPPAQRAAALGLLSALLPCGWLYAFVVAAAGTGGPIAGALLMTVFWAGTVPALAGVGAAIQSLTGPLRRHVPTACAVALIVVGLLAVAGRASMHPASASSAPACHDAR